MHGQNNQLQDAFLGKLAEEQTDATLFLVNGVKLNGKVTGHDLYSLVLERDRQSQLVYKSAISTIMPHGSINLTS